MIAAIQTRYKGYHFRSRLGARWAVLFDSLRLTWAYEPEGYILCDGSSYLPDFILPKILTTIEGKLIDCFVEVKPSNCASADWAKPRIFGHSFAPIILACGTPELEVKYEVVAPSGFQCVTFGEDKFWRPARNSFVDAAFGAARSARFEHGQSGAT